ncbi:acetyltransferase, GNAT family [Synechococcus sp. PCC 7335]|uniref:GNAT family N-acetyltransferase n=1 Tax=Synechococcus sp. (strain ATCC 29403 / PCC 7335) TaxID=91464 RepID=UPI00017EDFF5|nr:GNAT family N-acetyltransferase [Synechococcus sp. PCC 7335]EDX85299.1 acetyltransferase, GNAT family [Synechococcus sp. PCC 7335]
MGADEIALMDVKFKDFRIRDWTASDRDEAANVVKTVLEEYGLGWEVNCSGCSDQDAVEVEKYYQQTGGEFWVVERDRKIVGTGGYYPIEQDHTAVEIRKMYLLPNARGYGLGRFLLSQLEQAANKAGFLEAWVETATALKAAVRLYERNGYQPESKVDTERCDRAYRKRLS